MDEQRFEDIARALGRGFPRRSAIGILAGLAVGETAIASRKGRKSGEQSRKKDSPGGKAEPSGGADKAILCHREITPDGASYTKIIVSQNAVKAHLAHGDFGYDTCCLASECGVGEVCPSGSCQCGSEPACSGEAICENAVCCLPTGVDIQSAIDVAPAGGVVRLCAGTWTVAAPVVIAGEVRLVGAGMDATIIEAAGGDRVMKVSAAASAVVENLSLRNGRGDEGGCLHNSGRLELSRVHVSGGESAFGGGIYNATGGSLMLDACLVSENSADNSFDVPYQGQGGGIWNFGDIRLLNGTSVERNTASYIAGGVKNTALLFVESSSISNNRSLGRCGGLWNTETSEVPIRATLNDVRINDNKASDIGGGILNRTNGDVPVPILFITGGEIARNQAAWGGGIYNYSPREAMVLTGVSLTGNTPNDCAGGC